MNANFRNLAIWVVIALLLVALFNLFQGGAGQRTRGDEISYSEFLAGVESGSIGEVTIKKQRVTGTYRDKGGRFMTVTPPEDPGLIARLEKKGVKITALPPEDEVPSILGVLVNWFPMLLLIGVWIFFMRQMQSGGGRAMGFGKSKAKLLTERQGRVTFEDVAGVDEAKSDLQEIVDFLRDPQKFQRLGGRIPRGCLLVGPPGTGKTLIARAVAGEANVPFFTISGSDFVEMFVGVGASRVRDMFEQAKKNAPCIVFIDEIDAVGRQRGAGLGGSHDEREQTLNQILVEMDGFDSSTNVIVIAATNRPDVLDPALLRPGRFDRQVILDRPDIQGRRAILDVHARGKPLEEDVLVENLARQTSGFSGADLENLVNEAAILAARRNKKTVGRDELTEAIDRVIAGPQRKSRVISERERLMTAYHEAGHALVARMLPHSDPVRKVSIVARGMMGGYTRVVPDEDRLFKTKRQFEDELAVFMAGHVAEALVFEEQSTGAANDIERATIIARRMVTEFGMSANLGPLAFGKKDELVFLGREISEQRNYSDEVAYQIDQEIRVLIDTAHERARQALTDHFDKLEAIAALLIANETIEGEELEALFDAPRPMPDLVGPPSGRPATLVQETQAVAKQGPVVEERPERDLPPSGAGKLRPQPAG